MHLIKITGRQQSENMAVTWVKGCALAGTGKDVYFHRQAVIGMAD